MIILLLTALAVTLGGCRHGLQQTLTDMASELGDIVPRAINLLQGGRIAFLAKLEEIADH